MDKIIKGLFDSLTDTDDYQDQIMIYYDIAYNFVTYNISSALKYAKIAYDMSCEENWAYGKSYYQVYDVVNDIYKSRFNDIVRRGLRAIDFYNEIHDKKMVGIVYCSIGSYYFLNEEYELSYENYMKAIKILKGINYKNVTLLVYRHVGALLHDLRKYEEELEYYKEALSLIDRRERVGSYYSLVISHGFVLLTLKKMDKVIKLLTKLEKDKKFAGYKSLKYRFYTLKGAVLVEKGELRDGFSFLSDSLEMNNRDKRNICYNYFYLAKAYMKDNIIDHTITYLNRANEYSSKYRVKNIERDSQEMLVKLNKKLGNYEAALNIFEKFYESEIVDLDAIVSIRNQSIVTNTSLNLLNKKNKELKYIANHDDLTGIYSRRNIIKQFDNERQKDKKLYTLLIDVDNFKLINDQYGHHIGDRILIAIAKVLDELISPYGYIGRYGGDEFLGILIDIDYEIASKVVKSIIKKLRKIDVIDRKITVSGGIVEVYPEQTLDNALAMADQALYSVKMENKNNIKILL